MDHEFYVTLIVIVCFLLLVCYTIALLDKIDNLTCNPICANHSGTFYDASHDFFGNINTCKCLVDGDQKYYIYENENK